MKSKNRLIMSSLMALVLGLGISGSALAYQGDFSKNGPNYTPDFEAQITEVLSNKDYEGWKDLVEQKVGSSKVTGNITKDNFDKFVEAWKLAREGKIKEANTIRRELGSKSSDGRIFMGGSSHNRMMSNMHNRDHN